MLAAAVGRRDKQPDLAGVREDSRVDDPLRRRGASHRHGRQRGDEQRCPHRAILARMAIQYL
jgi:hypothetical protein